MEGWCRYLFGRTLSRLYNTRGTHKHVTSFIKSRTPNRMFMQGREASKQSHVSSMIHGSVLARTSLEDAVSCDVANKMGTTFLSPTEVRLCCE